MRVAVGCGTAIISFIVMLLLLAVAIQIAFRGDQSGYYSSNFYYVLTASPLLLIVSISVGAIAAVFAEEPKKPPMAENRKGPE